MQTQLNGLPPQPNSLLEDIKELNDGTALQILVDAVATAQLRGAYNISEAGNISTAIKHFVKKNENQAMSAGIPAVN